MIQMLFFLRFRSQLRRTRPDELSRLEKSVARAVEAAGGTVKDERRFLSAVFDEGVLAFWLDMVTLVETVKAALDRVEGELFGHACILCRDVPGEEMAGLCRALSAESGGMGVWCGPPVYAALEPYAFFEPPEASRESAVSAAYLRLTGLKNVTGDLPAERFPFREKIRQTILQGGPKNTLLYGPEFMGKRDALYLFCAALPGGVPPLSVRFGSGGRGPACFADAPDPRIREFIQNGIPPALRGQFEGLDALGVPAFRERLGGESSPALMTASRRFFQSLLGLYMAAAKARKGSPVLILENIHRADGAAVRLFMEIFAALPEKEGLLIYGTYGAAASRSLAVEEYLRDWRRVFPRIVQFDLADLPAGEPPELPPDLRETAYAFYILGRYFPGTLFPDLFGEAGKNPAVVSLALRMLASRGLVDSPWDPRPRIAGFDALAGEIAGDRRERIRALVRGRLLDWALAEKIRPCFPFLRALVELGERAGDALVLKAIRGDLIRGTLGGVEAAIRGNYFGGVVGEENAQALLYIYRTLRALLYGGEEAIREAFLDSSPAEGLVFPGYRIQILMNLTAYYIGVRDIPAASALVKETLLISQGRKESSAQAYRLFSLTELSRRRIDDALEYSSFAVDNAEKPDQRDELAAAAYYAAVTQFFFGNLSKAERLARRGEESALVLGHTEWADRIRFFRGRLRFEAGFYQDALDIFEDLRRGCSGSSSGEKEGLVSAWIYRARVFLRMPPVQASPPGSWDGPVFELEASFLAGDYRRTAALIENLPENSGGDFIYVEQPDWRSGFAQCEWLVHAPGEFYSRLSASYGALALSRLASGGGQAAADRLRQLLRGGLLPDTDPNDTFYFYAYYQFLRESGAASADVSTAASMAFKRLQRRASRIDDIETRRAFLSLHHWNGALSLAAREYKLI